MKRALYSLFRKGDANLVKILCLGAGLALGLIMLAEVIFERSYDNFIPRWKIRIAYKNRISKKSLTGGCMLLYRGQLLRE